MSFFAACLTVTLSFYTIAQTIAQNGSIQGFVHFKSNPISYAEVTIEGIEKGYVTDHQGKFYIAGLPAGKYSLIISLIGYQQATSSVAVIANQLTEVTVGMLENTSQADEVVVTGTMKESYVSESPIKVDVLSATLFRKNPTPTIFEALQMVNGVQPQLNCNVCNTGDIHINGMEGPYTMITIDGMPIVSALSTVYGLSGIPNSMIKRVEIVKGPASTLYGSEAVGGLINIITRDPAMAPAVALDVMATSQKEVNTDLSVKNEIGKVVLLTGINYFNFKNKVDVNNDNFTDLTQQDRISVFNKFLIQRKENRKASLGVRYVYEDRWGGETNWNYQFRGTDSIYGESIIIKRLEIIGQYQLPLKQNFNLQYSFTAHKQNSAYGKVWYHGKQFIGFAQLLWNKNFGPRHDLLVGFPIRYTFYDDNTVGTANSEFENKPQRTFLPGVFLQDQFKLNENFMLLGGMRYDYNTDHGSILSPRLGIKYSLKKEHIFRLNFGNGYRVVNLFTEDHAALTGARKVVINANLKPEKSWNMNINYQAFINRRHGFSTFDVSFFYTYFNNKIVGDFLVDPTHIVFDNLKGFAISKGITLNLDLVFFNGFKAIAGVTFMDVYRVEEPNNLKVPQLHAPRTSGTFSLSYEFKKLGLLVDYTGRINGPMFLPVVPNDFRPFKSPWFSIQNIQMTKKLGKVLELYGGVKNLFNFIPKNPLLRPFDPFNKQAFNPDGTISTNNPNGYTFDPSYNYAPIQGARVFAGMRIAIENIGK